MSTVYLTTTHPSPYGSCEILRESARNDPFGEHQLTDDPESADIIIFAESLDTGYSLLHARRHPLARRYPEKTFVHAEHDLVIPFLPGVFTSLPARFCSPSRARTGCYVWTYPNPFVHPGPFPERPYLFSFAGDVRTSPGLRGRVVALQHPESYLEDTSTRVYQAFYGDDDEAKRVFQSDYGTMLRDSLFVLCPRGDGPSTVRVFEAMKSGRAPVILSDDWEPPAGPEWDSFSIRIREGEVERVPEILESRRVDADDMGRRAREAWETWFAPEVLFHRTVQACLSIRETRRIPERLLRFGVWKQVARAPYRRIFLREVMLEWGPTRALLARRAAAR
jgi:hypothetical protein